MAEPTYSRADILRIEAFGLPRPTGVLVCVTGGRTFDDLGFVWAHLDTVHNLPAEMGGEGPIACIGFGCATGVDDLALKWAESNNVPWMRYVADWDRWGTSAGSIRNIVMLEHFEPDRLLVFPGGTGTTHCTRAARKRGIERTFFTVDDGDPFADSSRWG